MSPVSTNDVEKQWRKVPSIDLWPLPVWWGVGVGRNIQRETKWRHRKRVFKWVNSNICKVHKRRLDIYTHNLCTKLKRKQLKEGMIYFGSWLWGGSVHGYLAPSVWAEHYVWQRLFASHLKRSRENQYKKELREDIIPNDLFPLTKLHLLLSTPNHITNPSRD